MICTRCGDDLPIGAFAPRKPSAKVKATHHSWCRQCKREHDRGHSTRHGVKRPPVKRVAKRARSERPAPKPTPIVVKKPRRVAANGHGCCWLEGERPHWTRCNAPTFDGSSWCEPHYRVVFQPAKARTTETNPFPHQARR